MLNRRAGPASPDKMGRLAEAALEDWRPVLDPVLDPVWALARETDCYEAFLAVLSDLPEEVEPAGLVQSLAETAFQAHSRIESAIAMAKKATM